NVTGSGSGFSFTDGYGELVERVGTLTAQARLDSEANGAILKQATDNRDSLSAVNLDEEAANLIKFEQYYNASAQIIQVARSLFDTLISTFR
ncbi:MAG: flagellar basal body rod C-terminal domain-containing protein, partial [Pseudomonadaceae bacterium]